MSLPRVPLNLKPVTGEPAVVESKMPAPPAPPAKGKIPYWQRRIAEMHAKGTTPRDLLESDILHVDAPQHIKDQVHFFWMSNPMVERRPILPGFNIDCYDPLTPELRAELQVKVQTRETTAAGVPRVGDLFLCVCPKEIVAEQDDVWMGSSSAGERMRAEQERLSAKMNSTRGTIADGTGMIGEIEVARDLNQLSGIPPAEPGEVRQALDKPLGRGENDGQS